MEKRGISQEGLKLIACITMLIDHVGAVFFRRVLWLRMIGRIAFPIYCFLLVEGAHKTSNRPKYISRLAIGMLLSELPFDLALKQGITLQSQNVMVTLLLGYMAIELIRRLDNEVYKLVITGVFCYIANYLHTDYGGWGVLLIIMMNELYGRILLQGLALLTVAWLMKSLKVLVFGIRMPIELFAMFAVIPMACYSGRKVTHSKVIQMAFYLFYPVHLWVIYLIKYFWK